MGSDKASSAIEAANPSEIDETEFTAQDIDATGAGDLSSAVQYSYENGRRYHQYPNGRYPIPNDDAEQDREELKHVLMMELTDGKLFYADIGDDPEKIIDLGTGTGIWAVDVADRFPEASIFGVDFSPIQPAWVPPNVKFMTDDIEEEWKMEDDFDLIHLRQMMLVLKDPMKLLRQSYTHLKPGGWIEIQEMDGITHCDDNSMPSDYSVNRFTNLCSDAMEKFGTNFRIGNHLQQPLAEVGFTKVGCKKLKVPIGTWPKSKKMRLIGLYFRTVLDAMVDAMAARPFHALGMSQAEIDALVATVKKDLADPKFHTYFYYTFWTAQKPEAS